VKLQELQIASLKKRYAAVQWDQEQKDDIINQITYHSNKIEGLEANFAQTMQYLRKGLISTGTSIKDIADLRNHKEVLSLIINGYEEMSLTGDFIKKLHGKLMDDPNQFIVKDAYLGLSGEYKRGTNYGNRGGSSKEYLDYNKVPKAIDQLCEETNQRLSDNTATLRAINNFHYQFLNEIHPFGDGNGRMARLVHNMLLLQEGYPIVNIKADLKVRYIKAIIDQEKGKNDAFHSFMNKRLIEAFEKKSKSQSV
jgi:Fic family protein